ncbi:MAG TPA: bifunctional phosphopantothenoylcysteine decarboxylase/phosphopantothenate--cysteine ligase CoaBC [Candidatus Dormibacteraeota bacterium]|nr:bifunctional phosphopantothenoylcysteine decarboxylase/phosphopantothenate--cysteine ligase CoaBC [Candidatus Dormibacteraeota bacterium]
MSAVRLKGRRVALAISGGIAAYKAIECLRLLTEADAEVRVLMTPEATRFVTPLTLEALSGHPVAADWLAATGGGETHIKLAEWAEVLAIVPATANTIAKLALGIADEIVSGTALATHAPLVIAPAMNDVMFTHQQTQDHLAALQSRRAVIVEPATGRLASGKFGVGRLAAPERIVAVLEAVLANRRNLEGLRVVVSAGGTREAVDPVRYVGNFSSGKMGRALAEVAAARGAAVTLVTTVASNPEGIDEVAVGSAKEMLAALEQASTGADVLVMAAAVADYAPDTVATGKIRRTDKPMALHLRPNVDILKSLGRRPGLFVVGFAAETEDLRSQAQQKLAAKDLDLIVANQVGVDGQGLASDFNAVTIVGSSGVVAEVPRLPKWEVAGRIWDAIDASRNGRA